MLMFSPESIWRAEICYTNIVVSGLIFEDEKWRYASREMMYFIALSAKHFFFVIENRRRKIPKNGFLCILIDSEEYSIVTYWLSEN